MPTPIRLNGTKLAETRIRAGLTQAALAERVGVGRAYINRLESGNRRGLPATVVALATALGVDMDAITDRAVA